MNLIHLLFDCCAWLCSCLTPVHQTRPFYLHAEYFISPSISPQGLPVYAENLACALHKLLLMYHQFHLDLGDHLILECCLSLTSVHLIVTETTLHFIFHLIHGWNLYWDIEHNLLFQL
jgi:hypothetical protein